MYMYVQCVTFCRTLIDCTRQYDFYVYIWMYVYFICHMYTVYICLYSRLIARRCSGDAVYQQCQQTVAAVAAAAAEGLCRLVGSWTPAWSVHTTNEGTKNANMMRCVYRTWNIHAQSKGGRSRSRENETENSRGSLIQKEALIYETGGYDIYSNSGSATECLKVISCRVNGLLLWTKTARHISTWMSRRHFMTSSPFSRL